MNDLIKLIIGISPLMGLMWIMAFTLPSENSEKYFIYFLIGAIIVNGCCGLVIILFAKDYSEKIKSQNNTGVGRK